MLFIADNDDGSLWSMLDTGDIFTVPIGEGIPSLCMVQGSIIKIDDCSTDSRFKGGEKDEYGAVSQSLMCCPIQDNKGNMYGCLQVVNRSNGEANFSNEEELQMVRVFFLHFPFLVLCIVLWMFAHLYSYLWPPSFFLVFSFEV
jgi:hypothetical protein